MNIKIDLMIPFCLRVYIFYFSLKRITHFNFFLDLYINLEKVNFSKFQFFLLTNDFFQKL